MKLYLANLRLEMAILLRSPGFWVPTILFPAMLYSFFGASLSGEGPSAKFAIASFCIYAVMGVAFFQFGVGVAQQRESGFSGWQRTLANSAIFGWLARLTITIVISILAVGLVLVAANLFADPQMSPIAYLRLIAVCALVSIPSTFMGLALGYFVSSRSAVPLANMIFLPLAFLGGLWVPPQRLPDLVGKISLWTPTRHMGELAWSAVSGFPVRDGSVWMLAGFTVLFLMMMIIAYRGDENKRFG